MIRSCYFRVTAFFFGVSLKSYVLRLSILYRAGLSVLTPPSFFGVGYPLLSLTQNLHGKKSQYQLQINKMWVFGIRNRKIK